MPTWQTTDCPTNAESAKTRIRGTTSSPGKMASSGAVASVSANAAFTRSKSVPWLISEACSFRHPSRSFLGLPQEQNLVHVPLDLQSYKSKHKSLWGRWPPPGLRNSRKRRSTGVGGELP